MQILEQEIRLNQSIPDIPYNMMGHKMNIVSVLHFPYVDYNLNSNTPGSIVTLKDSVDARILLTLSTKLNFTYVSRGHLMLMKLSLMI